MLLQSNIKYSHMLLIILMSLPYGITLNFVSAVIPVDFADGISIYLLDYG